MIENEHIPQEDLILYAMQAMHSHELAAVRLHLDRCAACRRVLGQVNGDLALVAMSVDQKSPPEGARQRFVELLAADSPEKSGTASPLASLPPPRSGGRGAIWIGWLAAAALLLFALSLRQKVHTLSDELAQQRDRAAQQAAANKRAQQVFDVLTSPSAKRVLLASANAKPEPMGRAVYLAETGGLVFQASNLARLEENKAYELWVIPASGQAPMPAGLFRPDGGGSASVVLPPLPKGVPAKAFGVTIEKAEGSATPTAPILLVGTVPASGQ